MQVLGHNVKTDITKPRAVLNLSTRNKSPTSQSQPEGDGGGDSEDEDGEWTVGREDEQF